VTVGLVVAVNVLEGVLVSVLWVGGECARSCAGKCAFSLPFFRWEVDVVVIFRVSTS